MKRFLSFASIGLLVASTSCDRDSSVERPSGLKNMAPLPISEQVIDGLDVEPNDNFLQAVDVSLTGDAMQWRGSLTGGDVDVWRIKAKAGTIANIRVISEGEVDIIADYAVIDSESARRVYDVNGVGGDELLYQIRLTPQGGFLTVRARNEGATEAVAYRIAIVRVESGEENVVMESEPNDNRQDAINITSGSVVRGSMYPTGDIDIFRLNLIQPSVIDFEMPDGAYDLAVYEGGEPIWRGLSRRAQTLRTEMISGQGKEAFVQITALEAIVSPAEYRFSVNPLAKIPDEVEPNDTVDRAQMIQSTAQNLEFTLSSAQDVDVFRIMYPSHGVYRVRLVGVDAGGARISALTPDGMERGDVLSDGERICDVREEGTLLVRVSGQETVGVTWPLPYRLAAELESVESFESEPNSTIEQATVMSLGGAISGHIFPADDVDTYRIDIAGGVGDSTPVGKLSIDVDAGYGARLTLKLWDSAGYEISQVASRQIARPLHMAFDAPAGAYYLSVTGSGDNCGKPYTIRTKFEPKPGVVEAAGMAGGHGAALPPGTAGVVEAAGTAGGHGAALPPGAQVGTNGGTGRSNPSVDADLAQILEAAAAVEGKAPERERAPKQERAPEKKLPDEDAF